MARDQVTLTRERRRRLAADLFNRVWALLDKPDRTRAEDDEMLHAAHASRYLWGTVGTTVNLARGEWQCARVYATLRRAEPALWHARRCMELCETADPGDLADYDLPFAYEALARAHAVAGDRDEASRWLRLAREAVGRIAEEDDRNLALSDIDDVAQLL